MANLGLDSVRYYKKLSSIFRACLFEIPSYLKTTGKENKWPKDGMHRFYWHLRIVSGGGLGIFTDRDQRSIFFGF